MPGQIKIDDGSGNYTILTNGGSLGSDKTITIPNETATLATTNASNLGGLVLLGSSDASSSTNITFDNFVDNSTYVSYKLYIDEITPSIDGQAVYFIHRSSSPADITGTYYRSGYYISMLKPSALSSFYTNGSDTNFTRTATTTGTAANESMSCIIDIFPNNNDQLIRLINNVVVKNSLGEIFVALDASTLETATQMAGIKIQMESGNIASGKFRLFGVKG